MFFIIRSTIVHCRNPTCSLADVGLGGLSFICLLRLKALEGETNEFLFHVRVPYWVIIRSTPATGDHCFSTALSLENSLKP